MSRELQHNFDGDRNYLRTAAWALAPTALLLIPVIAMHVTDEVKWDIADFVAAGTLLIAAGGLYGLMTRRTSKFSYRTLIGFVIVLTLFLIWVELAVGIFS